MSFHPAMPYGTEQWHRSQRRTLPEGPEFAFTAENGALHSRSSRRTTRPSIAARRCCTRSISPRSSRATSPANAARHVAEVIGITTADVEDVVSYYVMFLRTPVGKFVLQVCTTLSCALAGAERVVEELEQQARRSRPARPTRPGMFTDPADGVPRRLRSRRRW